MGSSQLQSTTASYGQWLREGRSNWLTVLPTLHKAVPPELHVLHGANSGNKSQDLLQQPGREHTSVGMPGQRTACAATHGMKVVIDWVKKKLG